MIVHILLGTYRSIEQTTNPLSVYFLISILLPTRITSNIRSCDSDIIQRVYTHARCIRRIFHVVRIKCASYICNIRKRAGYTNRLSPCISRNLLAGITRNRYFFRFREASTVRIAFCSRSVTRKWLCELRSSN